MKGDSETGRTQECPCDRIRPGKVSRRGDIKIGAVEPFLSGGIPQTFGDEEALPALDHCNSTVVATMDRKRYVTQRDTDNAYLELGMLSVSKRKRRLGPTVILG